jgi:hypothetical protein
VGVTGRSLVDILVDTTKVVLQVKSKRDGARAARGGGGGGGGMPRDTSERSDTALSLGLLSSHLMWYVCGCVGVCVCVCVL